jgi:hypothetical protein
MQTGLRCSSRQFLSLRCRLVDAVRRVRRAAAADDLAVLDHTDNTRVDRGTRAIASSPSLPASRLLPPRSGLERSDFVLWPDAELIQCLPSRRLPRVKRTRCAHRELFRV